LYEQFPIRAIVAPAAARMGVDLSEQQLAQLERLCVELLNWNERVNLTSITDPHDVVIRHVLDSLTVIPLLRAWERAWERDPTLVDIGSGGGFPGLPIAIALPRFQVTLVDATAKKVGFLQHAIETLDLANARAIHSTAEELGRLPEHREAYDAGVVRAVGSIGTLVELLVPLLRVGGRCILMKKRSAVDEELVAAAPALDGLRAAVEQTVEVDAGDLLVDRALVVVHKLEETPERYPRRPGVPRRRPLGSVRS
jgi:16S rRNA (guanine527-N7)-methyltransferase